MSSEDMLEGKTSWRPLAASPSRGSGNPDRGRPTPPERLASAMIELAGEQGYAMTTVAHVIARAGAARRTFYGHFSDRQSCLLAAGDAVAQQWHRRTSEVVDCASAEQTDPVAAFVEELLELATESPSALRMLVAELPGAGAQGIALRERLFGDLAATLNRALSDGGEGAAINDAATRLLIARASVGGVLRLAYSRVLSRGRASRPRRGALVSLAPELAGWIGAHRRLPAPASHPQRAPRSLGGRAPGTLSLSTRANSHRGLSRGESQLSRSLVVHSQRERLLDAVANLSRARGYQAITIPDIVEEAAVSVQAFYEHFSGREDVLLVAYELGHRKALALAEQAYDAQDDWRAAVEAAISTLLEFYSSESSFAHLALVETPAAGAKLAEAAARGTRSHAELLEPRAGHLADGTGTGPLQITAEAAASALHELCYAYTASARTSELPSLSDLATHLVTAPFTPS